MSERLQKAASFLRANLASAIASAVLLAVVAGGIHWIATNREGPPPRKVMQYTMVNVQPQAPKPAPPPPPQVTPPKVEEQVQMDRVTLKASDIPPPDAPPPNPGSGPAAGPLALAGEATGPGDSFNLAGNPGGRGLLSGGGLGDGTGGGDGLGGASSPGARFGWYYAKIAAEIEEAFRHHKAVTAASTRVELRVWADPAGRITHVELVRSTGDRRLDEAIQSVVGLRLAEPPPPDIPMPMVARLTARRPAG